MKNYKIEPYNEVKTNTNHEHQEAYLRAKKRLDKMIGFYWHLASYIAVNIFIIFIIVRSGGTFWSFATFSTALFWGIGLFFHFLGVFGRNFLFSKNWEKRQIEKYMEDEKKRWE